MPTATGTIFDSLNSYTPSNTAQSGLAGQAAQQNIAAAPDIARLSDLINQINHTSNQNRVTGGAALEQQSSQNIANELAGNLPDSFVQNLQSRVAQRGATGGFGVDSPNMNAAALRGMGLESMAVQNQGQTDLNSAYSRAAPLVDATQFSTSPGLLQTQQQNQAQNALQAQQIGDQAQEWRAQLAERDTEFKGTIAQQQADLAARMGLSYAQMGEQARQFNVDQAGQTTRLGLNLAAQAAEQQANNSIRWAEMQQQQNQFGQTYALDQERLAQQQGQYAQGQSQQQSQYAQTLAQQQAQQAQQLAEFGTTSGQNAAQLYAQTYHSLPGYNQYGAYTGQTGTYGGQTGTPGARTTSGSVSDFWARYGIGGYQPGGG